MSYIEKECRDGSKSLNVDHGEGIWKVTFTRAHEEQSKCSRRKIEKLNET